MFAAEIEPPSPAEAMAPFLQTAPVDLNGIASVLGAMVTMDALGPDIAGKIARAPKGYIITINNRDVRTRQRFTLAHEIAHLVLHKDLIGDGVEDNVLYRSTKLSDDVERQANRYAADILMPAGVVRRYFKSGQRAISELASIFEVSPEAMRIRLINLGVGA